MTTFRSENFLAGILAFALVPWIAWTVLRGLRDERLPLGRTYVSRDRRAAFAVLLSFYVFAGALAMAVSADLLFNIDLRVWL